MTIVATYLLSSFVALYLLWIFYLAVMSLKRVQDSTGLNRACLVLGIPVLVIGLILVLICNVFIMTLILLELPQELTVTARLQRHHRDSDGYRLKVVEWFETVLDAFDPSGEHV